MSDTFVGVRVQGGLIPAGVLTRISVGDMDGSSAADYHLAGGESVRDAANRVWAYMRGVWKRFEDELTSLNNSDAAIGLTRERFLLPLLNQLDYGRIPPAPAGGLGGDDDSEKRFAISHLWADDIPIHLLGAGVNLDKRTPGVSGAAKQAPQSMVQEYLNRSGRHLWAILSNGRTLRLLRDSTSLAGSAYIEFDLDAIFAGELFSDFLLLYRMCHQSRLAALDAEVGQASCWMERWREAAAQTGARALDQLRDGVVEALETLGNGFLTYPGNQGLRERLCSGELAVSDMHHALLRVVYRLLFTFVVEDRGVLHSSDADTAVRERYSRYFSTGRLRSVARRRLGDRHADRWSAQVLVWRGLAQGMPELGLPALGGLFENGPLDFLSDYGIRNADFLSAVRALSVVKGKSDRLWPVDYRNLDAEELGSIYESLLEFHPPSDPVQSYSLLEAAGNERKGTGSFYTPTSLVECLLDSTLDPVLDRAMAADDPDAALLAVTVCDPACGSGHFLVAAARRIAKRLAAHRTGDPEPPPEQVRTALREVVGKCVYGVDVNPLAAELAKVSLWLEAMEPGRPLAFLDAQIKVGNALIGATPRLLEEGIPDDAFKPIEGDDRKVVAALRKRNASERKHPDQYEFFAADELETVHNAKLAVAMRNVVAERALSLADVHVQRKRLSDYVASDDYRHAKLVADAWSAAYVWRKAEGAVPAITQAKFEQLLKDSDALDAAQRAEVERLAAEYRFFHWHLEFPHLFPPASQGGSFNEVTGWAGGLSVICGNPPWERVKLQEQEFFAARDAEIAGARNANARKNLIKKLADSNPVLLDEFEAAKREAEGASHFLRNSGRYPLNGRGDINTYAVFAEAGRHVTGADGRCGLILPSGIATDATTQFFFKDLVQRSALASLYDFENARPLFVGVHRSYKFCLLTVAGRNDHVASADFSFFAHHPSDLLRENARFTLTPEEIQLLNPNTGTCPVFRTRRDAEITLGIYRRVPVLIKEGDPDGNPWGIKFMRMFDMSNDSHLFHTREELEADGWVLNGNVFEKTDGGGVTLLMVPLFEAKMIHLYDTRWATYEPDGSTRYMTEAEKAERVTPMPRYWVAERDVDAKLAGHQGKPWFLVWRWIARSTDERTFIASLVGRVGAGNSLPLAIFMEDRTLLAGAWASFALDFIARQKLGGANMTFGTVEQVAVPVPGTRLGGVDSEYVGVRVDRLNGWIADPIERANVRAELDAYYFHLYGLTRDDVDYVMETFPIVKRKDEAAHGEYRTKQLILVAYDNLTTIMEAS